MGFKVAFMGFRHGHINSLYSLMKQRDGIEIVAACEEHAETRNALNAGNAVKITHDSYGKMLDSTKCDAVAVGDYYQKRGAVVIEALKRGLHVIADKPICTTLPELEQIEKLAKTGNRIVGCMLDVRDGANFITARDLILKGEIGEVQAVSFGGQHPLMYGSRAGWYFEENKHGGTINDIAIHGIDIVPWLTGLKFVEINAARNWNGRFSSVPFFKDCAQMMLTMSNGCGVMGDVSYLAPDSFGYSMPHYWRVTVWGRGGVLETNYSDKGVKLYKNGEKEMRLVPPLPETPGGYLDAFLAEIGGQKVGLKISSEEIFESSRVTLLAQNAADEGKTNVSC
jgi:predicted dehydrogenase